MSLSWGTPAVLSALSGWGLPLTLLVLPRLTRADSPVYLKRHLASSTTLGMEP